MVSADLEWIDGGITAVPGILAAGLHSGIKASPAKDLALVYSSTLATAAGVFTTNRILGAPVKVPLPKPVQSQVSDRDGIDRRVELVLAFTDGTLKLAAPPASYPARPR